MASQIKASFMSLSCRAILAQQLRPAPGSRRRWALRSVREDTQLVDGQHVSLQCRLLIPVHRALQITRHAITMLVATSNDVLRRLDASLGSTLVPVRRRDVVLLHATPDEVLGGQRHLRIGIVLGRRQPVPVNGLGLGLGPAFTVFVEQSLGTLRSRHAILGGAPEPVSGARRVLSYALSLAEHH